MRNTLHRKPWFIPALVCLLPARVFAEPAETPGASAILPSTISRDTAAASPPNLGVVPPSPNPQMPAGVTANINSSPPTQTTASAILLGTVNLAPSFQTLGGNTSPPPAQSPNTLSNAFGGLPGPAVGATPPNLGVLTPLRNPQMRAGVRANINSSPPTQTTPSAIPLGTASLAPSLQTLGRSTSSPPPAPSSNTLSNALGLPGPAAGTVPPLLAPSVPSVPMNPNRAASSNANNEVTGDLSLCPTGSLPFPDRGC